MPFLGFRRWKPRLVLSQPTSFKAVWWQQNCGNRSIIEVYVCGSKCPNEQLKFLLPRNSCPGITFKEVGTVLKKIGPMNSV